MSHKGSPSTYYGGWWGPRKSGLMCGISGFIGSSLSREKGRAVVRAMCRAIRHRGPDDEGYYEDREAMLGMCRLSIIDIEGGHQPLSNEDGTIWVVFNGEIYNFVEL